jgi:hypothetical protein
LVSCAYGDKTLFDFDSTSYIQEMFLRPRMP